MSIRLGAGGGSGSGASVTDLRANAFELTGGAPTFAATGLGIANLRTPAWLFDATSEEAVTALARVPDGASSVTAVIVWANATADAGDVAWAIEHGTYGAGDNLGAGETVGANVTATAGAQNIVVHTTALSGVAVTAGGLFRMEVKRKAAAAADTKVGDAGLVAVELTWA